MHGGLLLGYTSKTKKEDGVNQALYRKYRSKKLSEIVGQEHITTTLAHALKSGRIAHAYLFTGPRGVGKTSIARILAHEINELPYNDESTHLDIIEIDAASNRRIDEIRDLRDKVHISPTSAKYKVYIIDEVHMLTKEAFNALLKTLEEPPAHVVFILATTEAHKLPETIISRTQRFHFKSVEPTLAVKHLREIADAEKFDIDDSALEMIAAYGQGSFRDSISLLDQVASGQSGKVSLDDVRSSTGLAPQALIHDLLTAIDNSNQLEIISLLQSATNDGISPKPLAHQLIVELRKKILAHEATSDKLKLMQQLLEIEHSTQPDISLELTLLMHCSQPAPTNPVSEATASSKVKTETPKATETKAPPEIIEEQSKVDETPNPTDEPQTEIPIEEITQPVTPLDPAEQLPPEVWINVLSSVKSTNPSLYSMLRMAGTEMHEGKLQIKFKHAFHYKRLKESKNMQVVTGLLEKLTGSKIPVESVHDENAKPAAANTQIPTATKKSIEAAQENDPAVSAVMQAFGGGEVVDV